MKEDSEDDIGGPVTGSPVNLGPEDVARRFDAAMRQLARSPAIPETPATPETKTGTGGDPAPDEPADEEPADEP